MTKSGILQAWFDDVWSAGRIDKIDTYLTQGAENTGILPGLSLGPQDLVELIDLVHTTYGPPTLKLLKTIEEDNWLSAMVEYATPPDADGKVARVFGQVMARFEGDKMAEVYSSFDDISYFEQVGLLPENTLALLLAGNQLK